MVYQILIIKIQKKTIVKVAKELGVDLQLNDTVSLNKLENKKTKKVDYNIELKNESLKSAVMQNRKEKQIFISPNNEISIEDAETTIRANRSKKRIYINDHMTNSNFNLLKHAKQLLKEGWKYVWYKFGKFFVKKSHNSNIIIIRSMRMVNDFNNIITAE